MLRSDDKRLGIREVSAVRERSVVGNIIRLDGNSYIISAIYHCIRYCYYEIIFKSTWCLVFTKQVAYNRWPRRFLQQFMIQKSDPTQLNQNEGGAPNPARNHTEPNRWTDETRVHAVQWNFCKHSSPKWLWDVSYIPFLMSKRTIRRLYTRRAATTAQCGTLFVSRIILC